VALIGCQRWCRRLVYFPSRTYCKLKTPVCRDPGAAKGRGGPGGGRAGGCGGCGSMSRARVLLRVAPFVLLAGWGLNIRTLRSLASLRSMRAAIGQGQRQPDGLKGAEAAGILLGEWDFVGAEPAPEASLRGTVAIGEPLPAEEVGEPEGEEGGKREPMEWAAQGLSGSSTLPSPPSPPPPPPVRNASLLELADFLDRESSITGDPRLKYSAASYYTRHYREECHLEEHMDPDLWKLRPEYHGIAVCTVVRNEARYLDEWFAFHWLQGECFDRR
jgi:hypothetical protein